MSLGEIFYQGRMIHLGKIDNQELQKLLEELEQEQVVKKENIKSCLSQMRREK